MAQLIANKFKVGDVVILKSGGPRMTVLDTDGDSTQVVWFIDDRDVNSADLHQNTLEKP